jgi:hypothetical protein
MKVWTGTAGAGGDPARLAGMSPQEVSNSADIGIQ